MIEIFGDLEIDDRKQRIFVELCKRILNFDVKGLENKESFIANMVLQKNIEL